MSKTLNYSIVLFGGDNLKAILGCTPLRAIGLDNLEGMNFIEIRR